MRSFPEQSDLVIGHFGRVLALANRLKDSQADIHAHEYDPHFSESWKIVAGSFRHRFQFRWDGHIRVLTISEAFFDVLGSCEGQWKELRKIAVGASIGADPFKYVEDFFST